MDKLASYLQAAEMTQDAFAKSLGVSQPTVHRWLTRGARPSWETAARIEQMTDGAVPMSSWVNRPEACGDGNAA
jgi:DNA-binding XRE family transcriptional regulator